MCEQNVPYILDAEAQRLYLGMGRGGRVRLRSHQGVEGAPQALAGVGHVGPAKARIHQQQAVIGRFHQQHVAYHAGRCGPAAGAGDQALAVRAHGAAVEVMYRQ